jgi:hypothetical protein
MISVEGCAPRIPAVVNREGPALLSGGCINGVEVAVETDHIDDAVSNGWRRVHVAVRVELPAEFSSGGFDGIEVSIRTAHINRTVGHRRRRNDSAVGRKAPLQRKLFRCLRIVNSKMRGAAAKHRLCSLRSADRGKEIDCSYNSKAIHESQNSTAEIAQPVQKNEAGVSCNPLRAKAQVCRSLLAQLKSYLDTLLC